ncbi:MAG: hypothetical protein R6V53_02980 [Candidatus Woesearchaeota archaeon]
MANETHYGVISDVHQDPRIVPAAIEVLKKLGAEKLLINGDIGNHQKSLQDSQNHVAFILDSVGKSGLEAYVQPGSHETLLGFGPVMDAFAEKYSNLVDATKTPKVDQKGHSLIFLPGSDFFCGGEYQIGNHEQISSGRYIQTQKGLIQFEEFGQYVGAIKKEIAKGAMQYANMNDLRKLVSDPDKSIVVCHVPRRFDNLEYAVDMAEFGITEFGFKEYHLRDHKGNNFVAIENYGEDHSAFLDKLRTSGLKVENVRPVKGGSVLQLDGAKHYVELGANVEIRRENRENEDLKSLYEELGINKAVNGHFHESGHRANDTYGNHVYEGEKVTDLFWNSGHLDAGQTGILTVGDGEVSYRNIRLEEHLR